MKLFRTALVAAASSLSLVGCAIAPEVKPVVLNLPPPAPKEASAQELFAQGIAAFDAGKLDEARGAFGKLADRQPGLVSAQYNLGVVAERKGELAEAERRYEAALKLEAAHRPSMLNLGKVYRLQDKFEKAIALYEEALRAPGNAYDVRLLNNLSVSYRLAKKYELAEATVRKLLARTKDNPDAYKNLALIYFDQGNYKLAEFISANAKKLDDKDPGVYNNLGLIYLKLDERRLALGQFQKSITLSNTFAPGHVNLGAMALAYRDYETAEKQFQKAIDLDPTSYEAFLAYAWSLDGQKGRDPKKGVLAGQAFEKVLGIKSEVPEAICGAAWAYAAEKTGYERAVAFLDRCKVLPGTSPQEQQLIDAKLKSIAAIVKQGSAAAAAPVVPKEKPKATAGGASLLDKVTDEAAKSEGAVEAVPPEAPKPAEAPKP